MILCNDYFSSLQDGAILVFLPGWDNISTLHDLLMSQVMFKSGIIKMYFIAILRVVLESYIAWFLSSFEEMLFLRLPQRKNMMILAQFRFFKLDFFPYEFLGHR